MNYIKKIWQWNSQQLGISSMLYQAVLTILVVTIPVYITTLFRSHSGEIAGALGSFLGGIIGAGGAVLAVYLALSRQREEEIAKVSEAVRVEVTTLVKYLIGAIEVCEQISQDKVYIPLHNANYIAKNFWFDPIVYPAVADRIGLLSHPQATVEFYMRIGEAKAILDAISKKPQQPSATYVSAPPEFVSKDNASKVTDSLITALQCAQPIIANVSYNKKELDSLVSQTVQNQISDCFNSAKVSFPNLESFKNNP